MSVPRCDEMPAHTHDVLDIVDLLRAPSLSVYAMAARAAARHDAAVAAACFGRSVAVACVGTMVKQGGSETAENDGRKLVNAAHPRCQRSLPK